MTLGGGARTRTPDLLPFDMPRASYPSSRSSSPGRRWVSAAATGSVRPAWRLRPSPLRVGRGHATRSDRRNLSRSDKYAEGHLCCRPPVALSASRRGKNSPRGRSPAPEGETRDCCSRPPRSRDRLSHSMPRHGPAGVTRRCSRSVTRSSRSSEEERGANRFPIRSRPRRRVVRSLSLALWRRLFSLELLLLVLQRHLPLPTPHKPSLTRCPRVPLWQRSVWRSPACS